MQTHNIAPDFSHKEQSKDNGINPEYITLKHL